MEQEKIEKIVTALSSKSLHISRVPLNTYNRFMEIANSADFCEDYGMAFRAVVNDSEELNKLKKIIYSGKIKVVLDEHDN